MTPANTWSFQPHGLPNTSQPMPQIAVSARPEQAARTHSRGLRTEEPWAQWAWLLGIAVCFLAVGTAGVWADLGPLPRLGTWAPNQTQLAAAGGEAMMADLAPEAEAAELSEPQQPQEIQEVPPAPFELPQESFEDLPELAEALVSEDLFVIPTAPKIEEALRPVDPAQPKPVVKRESPRPASTASSRSTTPTRSGSTSMARSGSGGGQGTGVGTGSGSSGRGTFVIPRPSYPSSLKALGVQGTVRLQITVGASGRATSVSVIGTSGNSALDQYAASWVRRNGKAPAGEVRTFVAPLSFVLR